MIIHKIQIYIPVSHRRISLWISLEYFDVKIKIKYYQNVSMIVQNELKNIKSFASRGNCKNIHLIRNSSQQILMDDLLV